LLSNNHCLFIYLLLFIHFVRIAST
jgi:hypothetical protein